MANPFGALGDLQKLQQQAQLMQKALQQEQVEVETGDTVSEDEELVRHWHKIASICHFCQGSPRLMSRACTSVS